MSEQKQRVYYVDSNLLDSKYDLDLTKKTDDGQKFYRGDKLYHRPYGWYRFGLKVRNKYEDNKWLGEDGIRTEASPGGAYILHLKLKLLHHIQRFMRLVARVMKLFYKIELVQRVCAVLIL